MKKLHSAIKEYNYYKKFYKGQKVNIRIACHYRLINGKEKCNYIVLLNYSDAFLTNRLNLEIIK